MQHLARTFADERGGLESQWDRGDDVPTDDLRDAFQRYRSFFERLLAQVSGRCGVFSRYTMKSAASFRKSAVNVPARLILQGHLRNGSHGPDLAKITRRAAVVLKLDRRDSTGVERATGRADR
jgi:hypothetical protein